MYDIADQLTQAAADLLMKRLNNETNRDIFDREPPIKFDKEMVKPKDAK